MKITCNDKNLSIGCSCLVILFVAASLTISVIWAVAQYRECRNEVKASRFYCLQHAL
jgi:hypothetical protein